MIQTMFSSGVCFWLPTYEELQEADDESAGFCLACGERQDCVEPDAVRYVCERCGERRVYGAAEFALRGWVV